MFDVIAAGYAIDGKPLLHPTDIRFEQGTVYGLIGHNGSGKSTLLKLLARQYPCSGGEICFDAVPLTHWSNKAFARQVAYLPQHLPLAESLTGRELIAFGRYPWHGLLGRQTAEDREQIDRAIALTGTAALAERLVETLSGGERQRIYLAMLIAQQSRFLLLDEPLAALDVAHQAEVMALIHRLSRELELGVIVVIHDINMAARYCDQLVALHSGRILAQGTPAELMQPQPLQAIYGVAMQVLTAPQGRHSVAVPV